MIKAMLNAININANHEIVTCIADNKNKALFDKAGINTVVRMAYFLGQCAVETRGFTSLEESLYYTTAARLKTVWPSRFKTDAAAAPFLRNPQKLANSVYAGRLGNDAENDGWLYRGAGMIQTTGKTNYTAVSKATGLDCVQKPELLRSMPHALQAAVVYWTDNKLNRFADNADIEGLTKAVQGGVGGLNERRIYTDRALNANDLTIRSYPLVKEGERGAAVQHVQEMLKAAGFFNGKIDAIFGAETKDAVELFQSSRNLLSDGVVGYRTLTSLEAIKNG